MMWCIRLAMWATVLLVCFYLLLLWGVRSQRAILVIFGIGIPLLWWAAIYGCPS